ncbi:zf-TFIIB domain-containing protein [Paenibacillus sp. PL2-23]|uniref:zf-TFIIB domain-containing protein n=1 Tax=Paenibacillus sp. PL2-23 TaxID=2100729 RepID=UPI0030F995E8
MKCPVCDDVKMREVMRDEVEIDVCPQCKGVWLDRGELEKLMQGVREMQQDYERMEQHMHPSQPGGGYGFGSSPYSGQRAPADSGQAQGFGGSQPPDGGASAPPGQGYGSQPYGAPPSPGGFGAPTPPPGSGSYGQPGAPGYPPSQGYGQSGYGHSGYGKGHYGYDKYGRPYKKKKTVLDVFGDLFD